MKKALVLGVLTFFAINIATVQTVNAQNKNDKKEVKVQQDKKIVKDGDTKIAKIDAEKKAVTTERTATNDPKKTIKMEKKAVIEKTATNNNKVKNDKKDSTEKQASPNNTIKKDKSVKQAATERQASPNNTIKKDKSVKQAATERTATNSNKVKNAKKDATEKKDGPKKSGLKSIPPKPQVQKGEATIDNHPEQ